MEKYNLLDSEEAGRLAIMLAELVGENVSFAFAFAVQNGDTQINGAFSNVSPHDASMIMLQASMALAEKGRKFKEVELKVN